MYQGLIWRRFLPSFFGGGWGGGNAAGNAASQTSVPGDSKLHQVLPDKTVCKHTSGPCDPWDQLIIEIKRHKY